MFHEPPGGVNDQRPLRPPDIAKPGRQRPTPSTPLAGRLAELLRLSGTYPVTGSSTASPSVVSSTNA